MFPKSAFVLILCASLTLASGCGRRSLSTPAADAAPPGDASYLAPPTITQVRVEPSGAVLSGLAAPRARIRLATPGGAAAFAEADSAGHWSLRTPPMREAQIFGLSQTTAGRQAQAQGYVLLSPDGRAALLKAGAGADRLDARRTPAIGAIDFDRAGGTLVSGTAAPGAVLVLKIDGPQVAEGRADPTGRFSMAPPQALARGSHRFEVVGDGFVLTAETAISPAAPLAAGPLHSQLTKQGLRVDWLTPGGGVQSTILTD